MGFWSALQIIFDILSGLGVLILLLKLARAPKDDPRLSRGLQILQSKIAILEDLSDRTENQVRGLMSLLDQKNIEVQSRIDKANEQVRIVDGSIRSSLDVARIFQDKIPHQEIIERKNTLKYLKAAKLANQGRSPAEIAQLVDLPMGEIEFIAKVNREQLTFSMEDLPAWAKADLDQSEATSRNTEDTELFRGHLSNDESNSNPFIGSGHLEIQDNNESRFEGLNSNVAQMGASVQGHHPYANDINYLGNSNDVRSYDFNQEISPLAAFSSEHKFQMNSSLQEYAADGARMQTHATNQRNVDAQMARREFSDADNKQISTLKRTQSIIANLDRQFSMSSLEVQEDQEVLPPVPQVSNALGSLKVDKPLLDAIIRKSDTDLKAQVAKAHDSSAIRKVIFPTINSPKINQRNLGR